MCSVYFPCGYDSYLTEATVLAALPVIGSKIRQELLKGERVCLVQFQVTVHPWKDEGLGCLECQQFEAASYDVSTHSQEQRALN